MPLDPIAKAVLDQLAAMGGPPLETLPPAEVRTALNASLTVPGEPLAVGAVENRRIAGPAGEIAIRIYKPATPGPHPVILYLHGGGWVIGTLDTHDAPCRALCNETPALVVAVDYRLAPEHKFPSAVDDCYAALCWVAENAAALGGDAKRITVAGDSAGGNLSAATALVARDQRGPSLAKQFLIYPVTDARMNTRSYVANADGYFLTRGLMQWFWGHYLRDGDALDPRASPLLEENLAGLPPALIVTAEFDPLRDEGEAYAARLKEAGVATELYRYDGLIHGFFSLSHVFPQAGDLVRRGAAFVRGGSAVTPSRT